MQRPKRLGILVGGGPAPGINSVISAATIEAVNSGLDVVGIYDGFQHLMEGRTDVVRPLAIPDVSRVHFQGGSILRTSRAVVTKSRETLDRAAASLRDLGLSYLLTIGGDGMASASTRLAQAADGAVRVIQAPKTIDNDIPLPGDMPTFGYETARHVGTELVLNLMEDARTTARWFFVVVMGRVAGHLALGIGKAAGATTTVIPEEFPGGNIGLDDLCLLLEGSIVKRLASGQRYGVAVIAEGVGDRLDPQELAGIPGVAVEYDPHGQLRLGEIPLATVLRREVQRRLADRGVRITISEAASLGYTLRSARPIPFDLDYTRSLGHGAVRLLTSPDHADKLRFGGLVCLQAGNLHPVPYADLLDPVTGRSRMRLVDLDSQTYRVARDYMIRLEVHDLEDERSAELTAAAAGMSVDELRSVYGPSVYARAEAGGRARVAPAPDPASTP